MVVGLRLSFDRVVSWGQAMDLLRVRNSCREGMTGNTEIISQEEQWKFYREELLLGHIYEAWVLYDYKTPIGYGIIKNDGPGKCWMTAGLVPEVRGKGLSKFIISLITEFGAVGGREVWIHVYDDNLALRGDIRAGYEFVSSEMHNGKLMHIMIYNPNRLLRMSEHYRLHGTDPVSESHEVRKEIDEVDQISRSVHQR